LNPTGFTQSVGWHAGGVEQEVKNHQGEEPLDTGGGRVFSLDASSGLLATRWRLWRQSGSSAVRSAFVV